MPTSSLHTLYLRSDELPARARSTAWLVAAEQAELAMLSDERRRCQWLAGRWVAKQLLIESGDAESASEIEICSRDERGRGSRPRVRIGSKPLAGSLSIAHTARGAMAALTNDEQLAVGVDLVDLADAEVWMGAGGQGFAQLWFTPLERCWIAADRSRRTATLWGIKEAVYKTCHVGQGWTPRDVTVWPRSGGGYRCQYRGRAIDDLRLEIQEIDRQLAVVVTRQTEQFRNSLRHELILGQAS